MNIKLHPSLFFFVLLFPFITFSQATFSGGASDTDLLTELANTGLILSNPSLEAGNRIIQIGTFSNGLAGANFQIDQGIIITTGSVNQAFGANGTNNFPSNNGVQASIDVTAGTYDDTDLVALDPTSNQDVVVFSFDVELAPGYSGIRIDYQFASEEYPDYVGSIFNDRFGFFVSGPGITGSQNIATIPGTSNPVTINTINAGFLGCNQDGSVTDLSRSGLYINNGHDLSAAACNTNSGTPVVITEYNGLTQVLSSTITNLSESGTYRLKIAIADTGDSAIDSAIFIDGISGIQECDITSIAASNISVCNDNGTPEDVADDFFTADITVNFNSPEEEGLLLLSGDVSASIPVGALSSSSSHVFTGVQLPADGEIVELTASFTDNDSCTFTESNVTSAPSSCSPDTEILELALDPTEVVVNEADGTATFNVTLTGNAGEPFTIDFATSDGTAVNNQDYLAQTGQLTFAGIDGEIQNIVVPIIDDNSSESTEEFYVSLSNTSSSLVAINTPQATGTIEDNDTLSIDCGPLPSPWLNGDIGDVAVLGNACFVPATGAFEIEASGENIWNLADEFHYVYQELTGDGEIIARVVSQENTFDWTKAGVMMRNGTDPDAEFALMTMLPNPADLGPAYAFQYRDVRGEYLDGSNNLGFTLVGGYPYYVRLVREGDTITGYASETNGDWQFVGSAPITMEETILIGLAVTSHNDGVLNKSVFDNVEILGEITNPQKPFITTWKTDNQGESNVDQITIPTFEGESYNYLVDWGDGTFDENVTGEITHTYNNVGTYQISISGQFPRIYFKTRNEGRKILSIDQWGDIEWTSMEGAFVGTDINILAEDAPNLSRVISAKEMFGSNPLLRNDNGSLNTWDVSGIEDMSGMFQISGGTRISIPDWDVGNVKNMQSMFAIGNNINFDITGWDVSNVTDMSSMFVGSNIDQNLGGWNVGKVDNMTAMLQRAGMSDENYDSTLIGWSQLPVLQNEVILDAPQNFYCLSKDARQAIIDTFDWTINDAGEASDCEPAQRPFITTWQTTTENESITIPTFTGETYDYTVDWGDGIIETNFNGDATHTYSDAGIYTVSISGNFPRIYFQGASDIEKILSVNQWGDIAWSSMDSAFQFCSNLDVIATDIPNLGLVNSTRGMFYLCSSLVGNATFNDWNVSGVFDFLAMFRGANLFNQNIGNWDVSNGIDMSLMFADAKKFNQDIGGWDVSSVTNMGGMFEGATSFNGDISNWNVSNLNLMFSMFSHASAFNQDISQWNVSKVTNMQGLFIKAKKFNQEIGLWDVGNVTNMSEMFFEAESFNQSIGGWDTSKVEQMFSMFEGTLLFDQDLSNWDVAKVKNMSSMFSRANEFNQNLSTWNVSSIEQPDEFSGMKNMFNESGLSDENYDKTLIGWSQLPSLQNGVQLDAPDNQYCLSEEARQNIIDTYGWTINDAGKDATCEVDVCGPLPTPWANSDIGDVGAAGSACYNPSTGTFEIEASGENIWNLADEFHFVYQELTGDGEIIARVVTQENTFDWAKAGVMMRNGLDDGAEYGFMTALPNPAGLGEAYAFQYRQQRGVFPTSANNVGLTFYDGPPVYLRLVREGDTITGYASLTNGNWQFVGSIDIPMEETIYIGLAVTSHDDGVINTSTFDSVSINGSAGPPCGGAGFTTFYADTDGDGFGDPGNTIDACTAPAGYVMDNTDCDDTNIDVNPSAIEICDGIDNNCDGNVDEGLSCPVGCGPIPAPWTNSDIGDVGAVGDACYDASTGIYEVTGSGENIWNLADEFHYVYQELEGDGEIIARVLSQENTFDWTKAGVMMRNGTDAGAEFAMMTMLPNPADLGTAYAFQYRDVRGEYLDGSNNLGLTVVGGYPYYIRLVRMGNTITGYASTTNGNWQFVGSASIAMEDTIQVGLAVTSHNDGVLNTSTFDEVSVTSFVPVPLVASNNMSISPNPANISAIVSFEEPELVEEILIFDMAGRVIQRFDAKSIRRGDHFEMNVYPIPVGTYIVRAESPSGFQYNKQMVVKR